MNPYIELEISIDASEDEIKIKFRSLAQIHHPDKGGEIGRASCRERVFGYV